MSQTIISSKNLETLFSLAARALLADIQALSKEKVVVAVPGGRSVVGLLVAMESMKEELPKDFWGRLEFFMVDERLVPLTSEDSNFKLVNEKFFSNALEAGLLKRSQLHPFIVNLDAADYGLSEYSEELNRCGGKFDVVVLGVGEDAHIGALFPNHASITNTSLQFLAMTNSPKPPPLRMTASRSLISGAAVAYALFTGEAKREALEKYRDKRISLEQCPVKLIDTVSKSVLVTDLDPATS